MWRRILRHSSKCLQHKYELYFRTFHDDRLCCGSLLSGMVQIHALPSDHPYHMILCLSEGLVYYYNQSYRAALERFSELQKVTEDRAREMFDSETINLSAVCYNNMGVNHQVRLDITILWFLWLIAYLGSFLVDFRCILSRFVISCPLGISSIYKSICFLTP